jgi:prepilin signal peptidase PulO-like enzyme (type II secretory pathway)
VEILTYLLLRILVALASLGYASIRDVKDREVPNKVWVLSIPICLILTLLDFEDGNVTISAILISLASALALGFLLFYLGFYGGADVKGLVLIAIAAPAYPLGDGSLLRLVFPLPFLLIFFSSTLLTALFPALILARNLADVLKGEDPLRGIEEKNHFKRLLLLATSRRISFEMLKDKGLKYLPAEKVVEEGAVANRKPFFPLRVDGGSEGLVEELEKHKELFKDGILASPTIPMMVFLTLGFALSSLIMYI